MCHCNFVCCIRLCATLYWGCKVIGVVIGVVVIGVVIGGVVIMVWFACVLMHAFDQIFFFFFVYVFLYVCIT